MRPDNIFVRKKKLAEKLKAPSFLRDRTVISDITDGDEYIRVNSREGRNKYDLTLILNTDGLALVKSAKSHCWPLMCTIAELPEHYRDSFILYLAVWYDNDCKPSMNTFLQPFCLKLKQCFNSGIQWIHPVTKESITSTVVAPLIIADAPARAQLQNVLNFNGRYGCNICEIRTKRSQQIPGKKCIRVYPFDINVRLRNGERMEDQARQLSKLNKPHVRGVKGYSILSCLPQTDLGTCLLPEFMHSVLLGVVKQLFNIYLNKAGPWNIKHHISEIDKLLSNIRPLQSFNRMPRPLSQLQYYKASEYYNLLLFYSLPVLKSYLPEKYFHHFMLLVVALFTLLKDCIRNDELQEADAMLQLFVKQMSPLYSDRDLTYNVHQLLHLVLSVRRWGPLWATSAFRFENENGFIAKSVHGTKHMGQEIVNNLVIAQGLGFLKYRLAGRVVNTDVSHRKKTYQLLGKKINNANINDFERLLLTSEGLDPLEIDIYARVNFNQDCYTSNMYKITKTNSHNVVINTSNSIDIYGIIRFFFEKENELYFIIQSLKVAHDEMFFHAKTKAIVTHIIPVRKSDEYFLMKLKNIKTISQVLKVGDYVCKRPNLLKKVW